MRQLLKYIVPAPARRALRVTRERLKRAVTIERGQTWIPNNRLGQSIPSTQSRLDSTVANPLLDYFDSHLQGPGLWKWRHYFEIYHRHFAKFVGRELCLLEIGIYSGGSIAMWKEYFGSGVRIFGVDIAEECKAYEDERTSILIGDQSDRDFWARVRREAPPFDIVIDDGSHEHEHQIISLEEVFPHVRSGGVYLCEDIAPLGNPVVDYVGGLAQNLYSSAKTNRTESSRPLFDEALLPTQVQSLVHSVHFYPFVFVIEKNEPPVIEYTSEKHGTQWQPWIFRQEHVIKASGGTDQRRIVEYLHEIHAEAQVDGPSPAEPRNSSSVKR